MSLLQRESARWQDARLLRGSALVFLILVLLPWGFQATHFADYLTYVVARMMILGLFAMSYDLLLGYTGIFSYGHASFIGAGAYTLAIFSVRMGLSARDASAGILLAILLGLLLGWAMGFLSSRVKSLLGVFLVTFAMTETLFLLVLADPLGITNGENGLAGIPRETALGFINIKSELSFYYFVLVLLALSFLGLYRITRTPFGDALVAIRENPQRSRFLGYRVGQYRIAAFMISGLFASLAGALTALHEKSVGPQMFGLLLSGDAFLYTVLGGPGTLVGPLLGTAILVILQEVLSDLFRNWMVFLGILYIVLIMFLPRGLFPLFQQRGGRRAP